ncbi:hypothetical protein Q5P01_020971 [Channa striata]|uniref:Uncharacterized protein n=1 Tax=Channa striata TaxID=64152 RepID=A0AA88LYR1_CHASR|nr:hypothetical protein Q5P01_020971 [Channa striata]
MRKIKKLFMRRSKVWTSNSNTPLLGNNNELMSDAYDHDVNVCDTTFSSFNIQEERPAQRKDKITLQQLTELLEVEPDAISSNADQTNKGLVQKSVRRHLPKPPADLDQNLQQHLLDLQNTVLSELVRLSPRLEPEGLMGCVIECYHRQTWEHLHFLLQNVSSCKSYFALLFWGLKTYLSRDMLNNPVIEKLDAIKIVDVLHITAWESKATEKLLESVQKNVRESLVNILRIERDKGTCDTDEDYVQLYVDIISCIHAMDSSAKQISSKLSKQVQEVCFQELLTNVHRYHTEQTAVLKKIAKADEPGTIHFFKTLKMCKELKKYVKDSGSGNSLCGEIGNMLQNMETFTLKLLMDVVADIAKRHLKTYFTTANKHFSLPDAMKKHFPNLPNRQDVQKTVMDKAYKVIVGVYVDHLINTNRSKLRTCWRCEVGPRVVQDAELLHCTVSELAPGVQPWNLKLVKIAEVLECNSNDGLKITIAVMQKESFTKSEDPNFLYKLLQWKGLSKRDITEVLDAIPPDCQPRTTSGTYCLCLPCL